MAMCKLSQDMIIIISHLLNILFIQQTPECKARVPDLKEGNVYQFRVKAVNKAGPGEPGEPTQPHTAKARFCKYTFIEI